MRVKLEHIVAAVAAEFALEPLALRRTAPGRPKPYVTRARWAMFALARELTPLSTVMIGKLTGGHKHTTVIRGARGALAICKNDTGYHAKFESVRVRLVRLAIV